MVLAMQDVFSSHINQIGHDPDTGELHVAWDSGKRSIYSGVPADVAQTVMRSWSVGKALTTKVKGGQYEHRYA